MSVEITRIHQINGFDPNGEPEVREMSDGSIFIMFNFMPPLDENGDEREEELWDNFDDYLEKKLGVNVFWEDRELFLIPNPKTETLNEIVVLLIDFKLKK